MEEIYDKEDKGILKFKRAIASTLVKYHRNKEAINVLEEILVLKLLCRKAKKRFTGLTRSMLERHSKCWVWFS